MVNLKIKHILLFFIILFIFGCKKKSDNTYINFFNKTELTNNIEDSYCFKSIQQILKVNTIEKQNKDIHYFRTNKNELFNNPSIKEKAFFESIKSFYENTLFSESYILEKNHEQYLIFIGQSGGATGIGVNYWNYECYNLKNNNSIRFSSLSKTPYCIFFDHGKLRYITIDDNYPRPASGEKVELKYYPVVAFLYSENGKQLKNIKYDCYLDN